MLLFAVLLHAASQLQASGHAALERLLNAQIIKAPLGVVVVAAARRAG